MRSDREEIPEGYSKEDADLAEIEEARGIQKRSQQRGISAQAAPTDCMTYWPERRYQVCGLIRVKYDSMGGPTSYLLLPASNELTNPDGVCRRSVFQNGPIYWSSASGAHPVVNHFFAAWQRNGWERGPLGYPTTDEIVNPDNFGRRQEFQNTAAIYWNANEAYAVRGAIREKWNTVNAERAGSVLGYPVSDEIVLPDGLGRMNRFERGVLYWHPENGAWPVSGAILDQWAGVGYERSSFGYPTGNAAATGSGGVTVQQFRNSKIYSSGVRMPLAATGASLVFGLPNGEQLQASTIPNGAKIAGKGFEATFALVYGKINFDFVRTSSTGPTKFDLLIGLPGGHTVVDNPEGGIAIRDSAGRTVAAFSSPLSFDNALRGVQTPMTRNGQQLQINLGSQATTPLRTYFVSDHPEYDATAAAIRQFTGLTKEEEATCLAGHQYDCLRVRDSKDKAISASHDFYPNWQELGEGDNKVDAMRHCTWLGNMTEGANWEFAIAYGAAHEAGNARKGDASRNTIDMDLHNNSEGADVGLRHEGNEGGIGPECFSLAERATLVSSRQDMGVSGLVVLR